MKHLKFEYDKAISMYNDGDQKTKDFLIKMYGKSVFVTNIDDKVDSYESACEILGVKPKTLIEFESLLGKENGRRQFARHKISTCCEAINDGWVADFENESEYKYYNWMYNKKSGLRLVGSYGYDVTRVGSDLYLKTSKKRDVIAKVCASEYATYLFGY